MPEDCFSTVDMRDFKAVTNRCYEQFMIDEIDKRLITLKTSNPDDLKSEKQTQAAFTKAVSEDCNPYYRCQGTLNLIIGDSCYERFYKYRAKQVLSINEMNLQMKNSTQKKISSLWSKSFKDFARGLCRLPKDVWKDKKAPDNCEAAVLLDMENEGVTASQGECS
jgi:hypothetical protein